MLPATSKALECSCHILRGALDCRATRVTDATTLAFGPDCLVPEPFDQGLTLRIAPAVARAASKCGVALRPIRDLDANHPPLTRRA